MVAPVNTVTLQTSYALTEDKHLFTEDSSSPPSVSDDRSRTHRRSCPFRFKRRTKAV